jgi:hypothetical protein
VLCIVAIRQFPFVTIHLKRSVTSLCHLHIKNNAANATNVLKRSVMSSSLCHLQKKTRMLQCFDAVSYFSCQLQIENNAANASKRSVTSRCDLQIETTLSTTTQSWS